MKEEDEKGEDFWSAGQSLETAINQKSKTVDLEGKRVVWVEDDPFLNNLVKHKLSATKCVFFQASEGEQALKIISKEMPDIVMLDIILPGVDGFEILRRMKADPKIKRIPVVILSNLGQTSDIEKGKSLGAERFIVKATVTPDEIIEKIKEVITNSKK